MTDETLDSVGRDVAAPSRRKRFWTTGRGLVTAVPYVWLLLFFLIPFAIVLKISFSEARLGVPPYGNVVEWVDGVPRLHLNFGSYQLMFSDWGYYIGSYLTSVRIAAVSTIFCLLIGYPMAYAIARAEKRHRTLLLMLIILPFWTSFLIRVYAWIGLLNDTGFINQVLGWISATATEWAGDGDGPISRLLGWVGATVTPVKLIKTDLAVYIGIVYSYLPFMILPLYANLEKMDISLLEAAQDLGCRPWKAFLTVTLPLSIPGIVAGSLLVFIPAVGEFVIPELLGGPDTLMIGRVLYNEFFLNRDWPAASALAIILLAVLVVPIVLFQRHQARQAEAQ